MTATDINTIKAAAQDNGGKQSQARSNHCKQSRPARAIKIINTYYEKIAH